MAQSLIEEDAGNGPKTKIKRENRESRQAITKLVSAVQLASDVYRESRKKSSAESLRRIMRNNGSQDWWKYAIFAHEGKYCAFDTDRKSIVWQRVNKFVKIKNLKSTLRHRDGAAWGCIFSAGFSELVFPDDILDKN
nr:PREDICTED: uncharacterized protein LOC105662964 [Megachile rotundata]